MQFDTAEPAGVAEAADRTTGGGASAVQCGACGKVISDAYYAAGDKVICPGCREAYFAQRNTGSRIGRLFKATVFGVVAGIGGALIWYGVRRLTGYEVGLIAIVVGLMVGGAVRLGSNGRGGFGYQILAVLLTYFSICANYMPDVFVALRDQFQQGARAESDAATQPGTTTAPTAAPAQAGDAATAARGDPAAGDPAGDELTAGQKAIGLVLLLLIMFVISLAAPFLGGASNIIGLLIIAFALWEAWKINKRRELHLTGPYALASGSAPLAPAPSGVAQA